MLRKSPGDAPGAPREVLGTIRSPLGRSRKALCLLFRSFLGGKSQLASGNCEMLENDVPLNSHAMFFGVFQGPKNETKKAPEE